MRLKNGFFLLRAPSPELGKLWGLCHETYNISYMFRSWHGPQVLNWESQSDCLRGEDAITAEARFDHTQRLVSPTRLHCTVLRHYHSLCLLPISVALCLCCIELCWDITKACVFYLSLLHCVSVALHCTETLHYIQRLMSSISIALYCTRESLVGITTELHWDIISLCCMYWKKCTGDIIEHKDSCLPLFSLQWIACKLHWDIITHKDPLNLAGSFLIVGIFASLSHEHLHYNHFSFV